MALASDYGEKWPVPNEPGEWLELRQLGYLEVKAARDEKRREGSRELQDMGGPIYKALIEGTAGAPRRVVDPINTHDPLTLLDRALLSWSYPQPLPPRTDDSRMNKLRLQVIGKLDEATMIAAARQIMHDAGVDNAYGENTGAIEVESSQRLEKYLNPNPSDESLEADLVDPTMRVLSHSTAT